MRTYRVDADTVLELMRAHRTWSSQHQCMRQRVQCQSTVMLQAVCNISTWSVLICGWPEHGNKLKITAVHCRKFLSGHGAGQDG